jgi:hypothetical protein
MSPSTVVPLLVSMIPAQPISYQHDADVVHTPAPSHGAAAQFSSMAGLLPEWEIRFQVVPEWHKVAPT